MDREPHQRDQERRHRIPVRSKPTRRSPRTPTCRRAEVVDRAWQAEDADAAEQPRARREPPRTGPCRPAPGMREITSVRRQRNREGHDLGRKDGGDSPGERSRSWRKTRSSSLRPRWRSGHDTGASMLLTVGSSGSTAVAARRQLAVQRLRLWRDSRPGRPWPRRLPWPGRPSSARSFGSRSRARARAAGGGWNISIGNQAELSSSPSHSRTLGSRRPRPASRRRAPPRIVTAVESRLGSTRPHRRAGRSRASRRERSPGTITTRSSAQFLDSPARPPPARPPGPVTGETTATSRGNVATASTTTWWRYRGVMFRGRRPPGAPPGQDGPGAGRRRPRRKACQVDAELNHLRSVGRRTDGQGRRAAGRRS